MNKCTVCGESIPANAMYYLLLDQPICHECASTLTLAEIAGANDILDVTVRPAVIPASFTPLQ